MSATGWLLELQVCGRAVWWRATERCGRAWTTDAGEAVRFSRRRDAEAVGLALGMRGWSATEHEWVGE